MGTSDDDGNARDRAARRLADAIEAHAWRDAEGAARSAKAIERGSRRIASALRELAAAIREGRR